MFSENPAAYLADFGVSVTWYSAPWALDSTGASLDSTKFGTGLRQQIALAILDQADEDELGKRILSRAYQIVFPLTQFVGIKHADAVVIAGVNYSVLVVKALDDGAWLLATLQAV